MWVDPTRELVIASRWGRRSSGFWPRCRRQCRQSPDCLTGVLCLGLAAGTGQAHDSHGHRHGPSGLPPSRGQPRPPTTNAAAPSRASLPNAPGTWPPSQSSPSACGNAPWPPKCPSATSSPKRCTASAARCAPGWRNARCATCRGAQGRAGRAAGRPHPPLAHPSSPHLLTVKSPAVVLGGAPRPGNSGTEDAEFLTAGKRSLDVTAEIGVPCCRGRWTGPHSPFSSGGLKSALSGPLCAAVGKISLYVTRWLLYHWGGGGFRRSGE